MGQSDVVQSGMSDLGPRDIELGYPERSFGSARRTPASVVKGLDIHRGAMWPVSATASSEYRLRSWQASQACGRPRVWPRLGDIPGAWAPRKLRSPVEWLEVSFDPGPPAARVRVFETCAPGAAYAVLVDAGHGLELAWVGAPDPTLRDASQLLDVTLPEPSEVRTVRVYVDNTRSEWLEIDTVALLSEEAPVTRSIEAKRETLSGEVGRARRYTPREIEGVDSLVDARGVWPLGARASSEWNASSFSASQLIGRPKVWPRGGDRAGVWAPKPRKSAEEWIEATFPANTPPTRAIRVFETCSPGCTVEIRVGAGHGLKTVWRGQREELGKKRARMLEVDLAALEPVERVWCRIDNSGDYWSEIDSIALLTTPRVDPALEMARGPAYRGRRSAKLRDRLVQGARGKPVGSAHRYSFFEMMARDWRARWRGVWPASARASSSHGGAWGAGSATGTPGIFPLSGDLPGAWAPEMGAAAVDWLELAFDGGPLASGLRVFETCGAGATFAVTLVYPEGEALVWRGSPSRADGARVLEVALPQPRRIDRVGIYVDNRVAGEPQIDSVGLVVP